MTESMRTIRGLNYLHIYATENSAVLFLNNFKKLFFPPFLL